jgi:hypothetical protein
VRVNAGQPQLYGTQFTVTDGEVGPCPIRTGNGWTSAAQKPDLNRLLITKPECETSHSRADTASSERTDLPGPTQTWTSSARMVGHPGNLGGSDSWEDAGSWRHRGSTPRPRS